jgi:membrane-bound lytic murein transglycosylase F
MLVRPGAIVALLALLACGGPDLRMADVDDIRQSGVLRVAVRPGFFEATGQSSGGFDEAGLLTQLASRLGARVEWMECNRHDQILDTLRLGRADIGVLRFSPSALLSDQVRATAAIDWVEDVLVTGRNSVFDDLDSVRGSKVHLHRSRLTDEVRSFLEEENLQLVEVPEEITIEETVDRVRSGRYGLTVIDTGLEGALRKTPKIRVLGPVAERRALVWAVREQSPRLHIAIDRFLFAERVLSRASRSWACRDLDLVRRSGVLRVVTRNSASTVSVALGGLEGFEYDLAVSFAQSLGLRTELSIPPPGVDPVDWLEQGYGDLAALHEPVAPSVDCSFLVSAPYRMVDLVSVISTRAEPPVDIEDFAGVRVAASQPVAELCRLLPLQAPMRAAPPAPGADAFNAMLEVAHGRFPVAVADRDAAELEIANRSDLQMGPVILPEVGLVWLFNPSSPTLHRRGSRFLARARTSGLVRQLVLNHFGTWQTPKRRTLLPIPEGALSPYDELLKWVGRRYEIDWRLLASLMYEESRFDPNAVGPGGSAGLFQFMPFTWRELGVVDPHDPQESAEAGGRYLRQMMELFGDLPLADQVAMAIASYNVGPRHVFDARSLAREMGFDPDRWQGSVETALLLLDDPQVARRFPAGVCRCRRAVGYTRRILMRYAAYTEQFPPA